MLRENIPVARTNRDGIALVSGLLPYQSNLLSVDSSALSADWRIENQRLYASAPRYGVGRAAFVIRPVRSVRAFLVAPGEGGVLRLRYGQAKLGAASAPIGHEGQVYFEDLAQGRQQLEAHSGNVSYSCALNVPGTAGIAWLGEIACVPQR